jgi:hypothetical protein
LKVTKLVLSAASNFFATIKPPRSIKKLAFGLPGSLILIDQTGSFAKLKLCTQNS